MDFGLTRDQKLLRESLREFLEKENPLSLVREIEEKEMDYSREIYRKIADLDWLRLGIPEKYGGMGGDWVDMAILYEEMGRTLLQSPHFTTWALCAEAILQFGTEDQRLAFLPKIADGEIVMTLALTEEDAGESLGSITTEASPDGGDYFIEGEKIYIPNAHFADYIVVVARTGQSSHDDKGIGLFIVDGKDPNIEYTPMKTLGLGRVDRVVLHRVRVSKKDVLSIPGKGNELSQLVDNAKVMLCAEAVGGAQKAIEISIDYAKSRHQFGVPIGSFQAIQHKISDMALRIDGSRWLTYYTAWLMSKGIPCTKEVAMTRLSAGETYRMVTAEAIQILGGYGAMKEHDIGLYFRRAKEIQLLLGYNHNIKEAIAFSLGL